MRTRGQMVGLTNRLINGQTDRHGWVGGLADGLKRRQTDGYMNGLTGGLMNGWLNGWTDRLVH